MKKLKRPKDTNQLAKNVVDVGTGEVSETTSKGGKNPAAVQLGRLDGLKGDEARAKKLSEAQRIIIA